MTCAHYAVSSAFNFIYMNNNNKTCKLCHQFNSVIQNLQGCSFSTVKKHLLLAHIQGCTLHHPALPHTAKVKKTHTHLIRGYTVVFPIQSPTHLTQAMHQTSWGLVKCINRLSIRI